MTLNYLIRSSIEGLFYLKKGVLCIIEHPDALLDFTQMIMRPEQLRQRGIHLHMWRSLRTRWGRVNTFRLRRVRRSDIRRCSYRMRCSRR